METTGIGSQPGNANEEVERRHSRLSQGNAEPSRCPGRCCNASGCPGRCCNDPLTDEVFQRHQTGSRCQHAASFSGVPGEVHASSSGLTVETRRVCTGVNGAAMLDLATGGMPPTCHFNSKTGSDAISSDCCREGGGAASKPGVSGTMDGHATSISAADDSRDGIINHSSDVSREDGTEMQRVEKPDGYSVTSQAMPARVEELESKPLNGEHRDECLLRTTCTPTTGGGLIPNGTCLPALRPGIVTGDKDAVVVGPDTELPNTEDGYSGEETCFPMLVEGHLASQRGSRVQITAPPGTAETRPPVARPNAPGAAAGATRRDEEDAEATEAASGPGLSYRRSPGPASLPCRAGGRDSAPLGPAPGREDGSGSDDDDEAFPGSGERRGEPGPGFRVGPGPRNTYESSRRQSAPGELAQSGPPGADETATEPALLSRRPGIADYFGRGLFSRKQRPASQSAPGWKLFGRVPLKESPTKDAKIIQQESLPGGMTSVSTPDLLTSGEYEARQGRVSAGASPTQHALGRSRKNLEFEPLSTTALILEDRPANLPAKSAEEAQRHRQQYDEMVAEAKRRELKEAQRRQKQMRERFKQEESIANAMVVWNNDILPHWDTMRATRRARDLWWQGLPPNVRGRVWSLAVGNELNITPELYEIFLSRATEKWQTFGETTSESDADDGASLADRESSLDLIKLDISRTFPSLYIFQKDGPYHNLLHSILGAYTCYRPDIGYVQGMSFIAAVLILNMEEADAFISFANLINKPCQMAFFRVHHELMLKYFGAFEVFFEENLPRLFSHFLSSNLTPDLYLIDWIFSLYTKPLPLDVACRVWDVFCRDGEEFLFRTGLGILRLYQDVLLQMDFIHIAQFLARLPDEDLLSEKLFSCIAATPMLSGNRKWNQVISSLMKDTKETEKGAGTQQKS